MANRWHGIGNMTADPEVSYGDSEEKTRTEWSIAINDKGKDQPPTYLDCVAWGKLAERVGEWGRKGRKVHVEGSIEVRKWEDRETGAARKAWRIKAYEVEFLDAPPDDSVEDRRPSNRSQRPQGRPQGRPVNNSRPQTRRPSRDDSFDDSDLPF